MTKATDATNSPPLIPGIEYDRDSWDMQYADRRLKVCWLEDETDILGLFDVELHRVICFVWAPAPEPAESVWSLVKARLTAGKFGHTYRFRLFPFDMFVTDHRLGKVAPKLNQSGAADAEAAGLTSGTLLATSFPRHPCAVVPYTAYEEQTKHQWQLVRLFIPECIDLPKNNPLGKLDKENPGAFLVDAVRRYREHLVVCAQRGIIHVSLTEIRRLEEATRDALGRGRLWPMDTTVSFRTDWGKRDLLLRSLWPEYVLDRNRIAEEKAQPVFTWLASFPVPSPNVVAAADIARVFFSLRHSHKSLMRYILASRIRGAHRSAMRIYRRLAGGETPTPRLDLRCIDEVRQYSRKRVKEGGMGGESLTQDLDRLSDLLRRLDRLCADIGVSPAQVRWYVSCATYESCCDGESRARKELISLLSGIVGQLQAGEELDSDQEKAIASWVIDGPGMLQDKAWDRLIQALYNQLQEAAAEDRRLDESVCKPAATTLKEAEEDILFPEGWKCSSLIAFAKRFSTGGKKGALGDADDGFVRLAILFTLVLEGGVRSGLAKELADERDVDYEFGYWAEQRADPLVRNVHDEVQRLLQSAEGESSSFTTAEVRRHVGFTVMSRKTNKDEVRRAISEATRAAEDIRRAVKHLEDVASAEDAPDELRDKYYDLLSELAAEQQDIETLSGRLREGKDGLRRLGAPRDFARPIQPNDLARLLDPLPEQLLTAEDEFAEGRIAKAVAGVFRVARSGILSAVLAGQGLSESEKRECERFSAECGFGPGEWPPWWRGPLQPLS